MADPTFDIVSKVDKMEADNAVNQAQKELAQRYDFKVVTPGYSSESAHPSTGAATSCFSRQARKTA
jgi:uncharacterized protein YajQ (UPF0234 family)